MDIEQPRFKYGLGNPQLGPASRDNPHPYVLDPQTGEIMGYLVVCTHCGGYTWGACPCGGWWKDRANEDVGI